MWILVAQNNPGMGCERTSCILVAMRSRIDPNGCNAHQRIRQGLQASFIVSLIVFTVSFKDGRRLAVSSVFAG